MNKHKLEISFYAEYDYSDNYVSLDNIAVRIVVAGYPFRSLVMNETCMMLFLDGFCVKNKDQRRIFTELENGKQIVFLADVDEVEWSIS